MGVGARREVRGAGIGPRGRHPVRLGMRCEGKQVFCSVDRPFFCFLRNILKGWSAASLKGQNKLSNGAGAKQKLSRGVGPTFYVFPHIHSMLLVPRNQLARLDWCQLYHANRGIPGDFVNAPPKEGCGAPMMMGFVDSTRSASVHSAAARFAMQDAWVKGCIFGQGCQGVNKSKHAGDINIGHAQYRKHSITCPIKEDSIFLSYWKVTPSVVLGRLY
jgi:hypothetical protein